jgi:repressor of nif and glnA expression
MMNKVVLAILKILDKEKVPIGSREIAKRLRFYGIELSERAVRYHLKILDERGYTEPSGKQGRIITEKGKKELYNALVLENPSFIISKIETFSYLTTLNLNTLEGDVILNVSFFPERDYLKALKIMKPVFRSPYVMSDRVMIKRGGEYIGDICVPKGKMGIATVCSITINGILLKAGIPIISRFGGLAEVANKELTRFVSVISYEGSSLDPHDVFIRSRMTEVTNAVKKGQGKILASFREIPIVCIEKVKQLCDELVKKNIKGILAVGEPNKPLLGVQPSVDRAGLVIAGGLNPIAALEEAGIVTENNAMATVCPFSYLKPFAEIAL